MPRPVVVYDHPAWVSRPYHISTARLEFLKMLRFCDSAVPLGGLAKRSPLGCLPNTQTVSTHGKRDFGAQWLACLYHCCGYTRAVAGTSVQLAASVFG